MHLSIACLALFPIVALAYQPPWSIERVVKRGSYSLDTFTGDNIAESQESLPATQVEYTTAEGVSLPNPFEVQRIGPTGPLLLQDIHLIESLAHFDRERTPERVVHAKGSGAHGYFVTTTDFAKTYSMADVFQRIGEKTPLSMRFSSVGGEKGSADSARDPRGFAIKLRTKKGSLDWVFNNTPVFFIRDPLKFSNFIHTQKRNPQTNLKDKDLYWDYLSSNPESLYQVMRMFSDLGTPASWRNMNGWSGHTYRLVQSDDSWVYVKVIVATDQGIKNFTDAEATTLAGTNPDYLTQDLFEAIESGNYPSWTVSFQILNATQAENYKFNALDLTKDWDPLDVPYHEVGKIVLTQNPENNFAEIEQAAYSPSNLVPGWEPSADPVLQARLFSYPDTHRHRLGANYQQIPINCPFAPVANFQRDSFMSVQGNQGSRPNYNSSIEPINFAARAYQDNHTIWTGGALRYLSTMSAIDYEWPRVFWGNLSTTDQDHLVSNVVGHLGLVKSAVIRQRQAQVFALANATLGARIAQGIKVTLN